MVRENALPTLVELLSDQNESVILNVIKTITNCAEDYRGRFQLHGALKQVRRLEEARWDNSFPILEENKDD